MCFLSYVFRPQNVTKVSRAADERTNNPEDNPEAHVHERVLFENKCTNTYFFILIVKLFYRLHEA